MLLATALTIFLGFIFFDPEQALAWGPATHLSIAFAALDRLSVLKPALHLLLAKYGYDFLYGCLASDMVLGKRFARYRTHCHNWKVALRILQEAATPANKAFAFGYLSHLAADTVSHNRFVPSQIVATFTNRTVRHVYWEVRFDSLLDQNMWHVAKTVVRNAQQRNHRLLRGVLEKTSLSFKTAETVFNGYLLLGRINRWQRLIRYHSTKSKWELPQKSVDDYLRQSLDAVLEVLLNGAGAPCVKLDPMGRESLVLAKKTRRLLRAALKRKGRTLPSRGKPVFSPLIPARLPSSSSAPRQNARGRAPIHFLSDLMR